MKIWSSRSFDKSTDTGGYIIFKLGNASGFHVLSRYQRAGLQLHALLSASQGTFVQCVVDGFFDWLASAESTYDGKSSDNSSAEHVSPKVIEHAYNCPLS